MKQPVLLRKRDDGLFEPYGIYAADVCARIKPGRAVMAEDRDSPSAKLRNFYFAMLKKVVDNHPQLSDVSELHDIIKIDVRWVTHGIRPSGEPYTLVRTAMSDRCSLTEQREFWGRALDYITAHVLPVSPKDLVREVEQMVGYSLTEAMAGNRPVKGEPNDDGNDSNGGA
jgi:hypothetical protein